MKIQATALWALYEVVGVYFVKVLEDLNLCSIHVRCIHSCHVTTVGMAHLEWDEVNCFFTYLFTLHIYMQTRCCIYDTCYLQEIAAHVPIGGSFSFWTAITMLNENLHRVWPVFCFIEWSNDLSNHTDYAWLCLRTIYFRIFLDILLNGRFANQSDLYLCLFACEHACLTCLTWMTTYDFT